MQRRSRIALEIRSHLITPQEQSHDGFAADGCRKRCGRRGRYGYNVRTRHQQRNEYSEYPDWLYSGPGHDNYDAWINTDAGNDSARNCGPDSRHCEPDSRYGGTRPRNNAGNNSIWSDARNNSDALYTRDHSDVPDAREHSYALYTRDHSDIPYAREHTWKPKSQQHAGNGESRDNNTRNNDAEWRYQHDAWHWHNYSRHRESTQHHASDNAPEHHSWDNTPT